MLKLRSRDLPNVKFRRALPEYLANGPCFIEVDARAGGAANPAYAAGQERLYIQARIADRGLEKITDDKAHVETNWANMTDILRARLGLMYDACVIEWRCNILNDDVPVVCDRGTFLELADAKVPEIAAAIQDLEKAIMEAGAALQAETQAVIKN